MISIGEAAEKLGVRYNWIHRWVKKKGLGQKCGWGVVLSAGDLEVLKTCGRLPNGQNSQN